MKEGKRFQNPVKKLLCRYEPEFTDAKDTVVISYLGRILNKEFRYSAGDMASLEIQTLSFEEFLDAAGKQDEFNALDIFGSGEEKVYQDLSSWYGIYRQVGGYPAVVLRYLEGASVKECREELQEIIRLFTNESRRYFYDILDYEAYGNLFCSFVTRTASVRAS